MFNNLTFYTDGACSGNPGPGGFGVVCLNTYYSQTIYDYIERHTINYTYSEQSESTTHNREELKATLHVLKIAAEHKEYNFTIYSDSAYAVNSINTWMYGWARNGWVNSKKKPVENLDLIQEIYSYLEFPMENFDLRKINGHSGHLGNELADALAKNNMKKKEELKYRYSIGEYYATTII